MAMLSLTPRIGLGQTVPSEGPVSGISKSPLPDVDLLKKYKVQISYSIMHSVVRWLGVHQNYSEIDTMEQGPDIVYSYVQKGTGKKLELKTREVSGSIVLGIRTVDDVLHAEIRAIIANLFLAKNPSVPVGIRLEAVQRLTQLGYQSLLADLIISEENVSVNDAAIDALKMLSDKRTLLECVGIAGTIVKALEGLISFRVNGPPPRLWETEDYLRDFTVQGYDILSRKPPQLIPLDPVMLQIEESHFLHLIPKLTRAAGGIPSS